ncbi:sensor histidine kinase [Collinsella tanakaei]|nr:sensor histidine kinase [Collinsella tanakaei]
MSAPLVAHVALLAALGALTAPAALALLETDRRQRLIAAALGAVAGAIAGAVDLIGPLPLSGEAALSVALAVGLILLSRRGAQASILAAYAAAATAFTCGDTLAAAAPAAFSHLDPVLPHVIGSALALALSASGADPAGESDRLTPLSTPGLKRLGFAAVACLALTVATMGAAGDAGAPVRLVICATLILLYPINAVNAHAAQQQRLADAATAQAELLERNYRTLRESYEQNSRLYHDFRNHLATLKGYARAGDMPAVSAYIDALVGPQDAGGSAAWTGDPAIDHLFALKQARCTELGIAADFDVCLPPNTGIRPADLSTVVANLLDNAIEAAAQVPEGRARTVRLTARRVNNMVIIKVENTATGPVEADGEGRIATTKEDAEHHGWGLKSVEATLDRYDGSLSLTSSDDSFCAIATMCFDGVRD